jgi:hypothetical protein
MYTTDENQELSDWQTMHVSADQASPTAHLDDLSPDTLYSVRIRAENPRGAGPASSVHTVRTKFFGMLTHLFL